MFNKLIELFDSCEEIELEGYCECIVDTKQTDNTFNNNTQKIYILYINTNNGRHSVALSVDFNIYEIYKTYKYEMPEDMFKKFSGFNVLNIKYFAINEFDYLERKLLKKMEDEQTIVFLLYDFIFTINKSKFVDNADFFIKKNRTILPVDEEKFISSVIYSKRTTAKPNSLEEKIYHFEDVSNKYKEIFYKNKKESSGFKQEDRKR